MRHGLAAGVDERVVLQQVERRITADAQLREDGKLGALRSGAACEIDDERRVAGDVTDGRIDLRQG